MSKFQTPVLEVIACSVADAVNAEQGGASRLEVISEFDCDGMTPPIKLVREILAAVSLPVRVMLRESDDYGVRAKSERERLCAAAGELSALPVDGLVLGFLKDGEVDTALMDVILSHAPRLSVTFHRAFEGTRDPCRAIETLKRCGQVDRILTGGGRGEWSDKLGRLAAYVRQAGPQLTIMVGGGLNRETIPLLGGLNGTCELHVGRAARRPPTAQGTVQVEQVRELAAAVKLLQERRETSE